MKLNLVACIVLFLQGLDLVPEPRIIVAALKACRRVNDYALAVRYMEAVQVFLYYELCSLKIITHILIFVIYFPEELFIIIVYLCSTLLLFIRGIFFGDPAAFLLSY